MEKFYTTNLLLLEKIKEVLNQLFSMESVNNDDIQNVIEAINYGIDNTKQDEYFDTWVYLELKKLSRHVYNKCKEPIEYDFDLANKIIVKNKAALDSIRKEDVDYVNQIIAITTKTHRYYKKYLYVTENHLNAISDFLSDSLDLSIQRSQDKMIETILNLIPSIICDLDSIIRLLKLRYKVTSVFYPKNLIKGEEN